MKKKEESELSKILHRFEQIVIDNKTKTVYVVGMNWVEENDYTRNKYYENKFRTFIYGVYEDREVAKAVVRMLEKQENRYREKREIYIDKQELNAINDGDLGKYLIKNPFDYDKVVALSDAIQHNSKQRGE